MRGLEPPPAPQHSLAGAGDDGWEGAGGDAHVLAMPELSQLCQCCGWAHFGCSSQMGLRKGGVAPHAELAPMQGGWQHEQCLPRSP